MSRLLLVTLLAAALVPLGTASGREPAWRLHRGTGFTVKTPASWKVVPATRTATLALARSLHAQGQIALASAYREIGEDGYHWQKPLPLLNVFQWPWPPPPASVSTDMLVKRYPSGGYSLRQIAQVLKNEVDKHPGTTLKGPRHLTGTAEDCYVIEAKVKLGTGYDAEASYSFVYLYLRGRWLYQLPVRGEAGLEAGYRPIANRIAASFRFN